LYDGIENSVFQSQILQVANEQLQSKFFEKIVILSFENSLSAAQELLSKMPIHHGLEFSLLKKTAFIGAFSLESCIEAACNQIFKIFPQQIIARGPIAGYIALKALCRVQDERQLLQNPNELPKLTIQARGLLAKEYEYSQQFASWNPFMLPVRWFIAKQKLAVEKAVYAESNLAKMPFEVTIEAVTGYLADYLVEEFGASPQRIQIAQNDLVPHLSAKQLQQYRQQSRHKLGLVESSLVYCYAGSAKPWQYCNETVELFWELFENNPITYFLILTTEPDYFTNLLKAKNIPADNFAVITTHDQEEYLKLMCAADIGVILRQDHVINWVARPTKVLDYLACGLKLKHNNTIGWVIEVGNQANAEIVSKVKPLEVASEKVTAAKRAPKITLEKTATKNKVTAKSKAASAKTVSKKPVLNSKELKAKATASSKKAAVAKSKVVAKSSSKKPVAKATATPKKKPKSQANL
jgi:hypothetical protein